MCGVPFECPQDRLRQAQHERAFGGSAGPFDRLRARTVGGLRGGVGALGFGCTFCECADGSREDWRGIAQGDIPARPAAVRPGWRLGKLGMEGERSLGGGGGLRACAEAVSGVLRVGCFDRLSTNGATLRQAQGERWLREGQR